MILSLGVDGSYQPVVTNSVIIKISIHYSYNFHVTNLRADLNLKTQRVYIFKLQIVKASKNACLN